MMTKVWQAEAALKVLAERFGISLDNGQLHKRTQTGELRLKTWSREEIQIILEAAWEVMHDTGFLPPEQTVYLTAYHQGIEKTISSLARSFGIKG